VLRVAGSGPSGLAAAITLARHGRAVEVHERRDRAGSRFGGGHQILAHYGEAPRAVSLLRELGVEVEALEGRWLSEARFHFAGGGQRDCTAHRPFAYLLRRGADSTALDGALVEAARAAGVRIHESSRLDDAEVLATGPARVDGMAIELLCETDLADRVDVLLDPVHFGGGYAYLLVHGGEATLGVAVLRDFRDLDEMVDRALVRMLGDDAPRVHENVRVRHTMSYGVPTSAVVGRSLRVGEAAGFQDYLFGLGIRNALLSGRLAARCLLEEGDFDRRWRRALLPRMRASEVDRWLYERGWLGWILERAPRHRLDRSLDLLHRGSRLRASIATLLGSGG
jgi:flavin-dependent dehydrogenase